MLSYMFNKMLLDCIFFDSYMYALLSGRKNIAKQDILIAIKRVKYGYVNFQIPFIVEKVYESVYEDHRLPIFRKLVESI